MDSLKRLAASAVVPVVVLDDAKDAVATAKALLAGGVDVMEITFRTAAAPDAIKAVADNCPDMLVGAGTVITLEQCQKAVEMGAKFIVSPGFDAEVVKWCVDNGVLPEAMIATDPVKDLEWADVLVAGPGIGTSEEAKETLTGLLRASHLPTVLDADALNLLAEDQELMELVREKASKQPVILTPHPGEFLRLSGFL